MLGKNLWHVKITKLFFAPRNHIIKFFSTTLKEQAEISNDIPLLNNYLKESLISISGNPLKEPQMNIIDSINKNLHSIILCDEFNGRKYSCALGIMNKIINNKESQQIEEENSDSEELFVNTLDAYKRSKDRTDENTIKKILKPRGALVICQKFEFATHFYRICRKLDYKNKLRMVRVGTSLHTVSPTVELDVKNMTESDEYESQEILLGNVNLINTTEWKNIDILFITPQMLEYVFNQKDEYDFYDINPEIIMIDDFDYIFKYK